MTTILPEKNKKENKKQYLIGFLSRFFAALIFLCVLSIIFEVTTHFVINFEKKVLEENFNEDKEKQKRDLFNEYKETLDKTKSFVKLFSFDEKHKIEIVDYVFGLNGENISINFVSVEDFEEGLLVRVSGISKNREALISMKNSLDLNENIENIQLPISSFTKTFDIPFTLNFEYEYEK